MSFLDTLIPTISRAPANRENGQGRNLTNALKPMYEIKESDDAYGLTVYLPGVMKDGLELTAETSELRILGRRVWKQPENWTSLYRESADAPFELVLTHDNAIDADKIAAELRDGVLRVSLPKAEALKPRKIEIK